MKPLNNKVFSFPSMKLGFNKISFLDIVLSRIVLFLKQNMIPIEWAKNMSRQFKEMEMTFKHMKRCSTSWSYEKCTYCKVPRECLVFSSICPANICRLTIILFWQRDKKIYTMIYSWWWYKLVQLLKINLTLFVNVKDNYSLHWNSIYRNFSVWKSSK